MNDEKQLENPTKRSLFGSLATLGAAAAGGWILYSATMIDHNVPLPLAISSERHLFTSSGAGLLNYYVDDSADGRPLALIHSINAAASSYEMRPLFDHFRGKRPVYALDLPGFGFSERSNRHYSPKMYAAAIIDFLNDIVGEPADVIALSLGSEFAARAANESPALFHSLTLISPTGFSAGAGNRASQRVSRNDSSVFIHRLFSVPLWSQAFFDLLVTKRSIHFFLKQSFNGPPDPGLEAYGYLSAHQQGARFAPLYFVSGRLFSPDVRKQYYEKVQVPGLILYDEDAFTSFAEMPDLLLAHPSWSAVRITPTRGLPQFEQLEATARVLENFWKGIS